VAVASASAGERARHIQQAPLESIMKNGYEAARRVVEKFVELGVGHMVVGGLSSNAYGIPRATWNFSKRSALPSRR